MDNFSLFPMKNNSLLFIASLKARAKKKPGFYLMIVHFYIRRKLDIIRCQT